MNRGPLIFLGVFLAAALSWQGMVVLPQLQIGGLQQTNVPPAGLRYPIERSGLAQQGREVYRANGCYYCHTQQVRPRGLGADYERGWGKRHSVAPDFLYEEPVLLGTLRAGPDLANIGSRQTNEVWHLLHLYSPPAVVTGSTMPAYPFLFEKRKIGSTPSADALKLAASAGFESGFEIVPKPQAYALVAYLLSLQAENHLFEAPLPLEPKKPEPAAATNQTTAALPERVLQSGSRHEPDSAAIEIREAHLRPALAGQASAATNSHSE